MDAGKLPGLLSREAWTKARTTDDAVHLSEGMPLDPNGPSPVSSMSAIYHGDDGSVSESLLAKSGVDAYLTVINISEVNRLYDKAFDLLTIGLGRATQPLQVAYHDARTALSPELRDKDWSFSVHDGKLVFKEGDDKLSEEEMAQLRQVFEANNIEQAAVSVSETIIDSIALKRESTELGRSRNYSWGRFEVDRENFDEIVNLREYTESLLPGGKYNENPVNRYDYGALHTVTSMYAMIDLIAAKAKVISPT